MRTGNLTEPVLMRSVLGQLDTDPSRKRRQYGADCAVLPGMPGDLTVCATVNGAPGFSGEPAALVTAAVNALEAAGASPFFLTVSAVLPPAFEEVSLQEDMRRFAASVREAGMTMANGDIRISKEVCTSQYTVTGFGRSAPEDYRGDELLQSGQELVLTKWIALAGTAAIAINNEKELGMRYPFLFVNRAKELRRLLSIAAEARAATHFGGCVLRALSQGGIFNALWEMAERAGTGLEVDLKRIPVKQETIELCEYYDINPYYLYSAGALLIGTFQAEALIGELTRRGIPAAVIGRVTGGNDRIIRKGEDVRFLDRPQQEEWYRRFER